MQNDNFNNDLKSHLNQLSKNEIIDLIFEYVPHEHLRSINNTRIEKNEASVIFEEVRSQILVWLNDNEFTFKPYLLEEGLIKQLNILRGLETQILPQLSELILVLIEKINLIIDQGNLYDYKNDYTFDFPEEFINLIEIVLKSLEAKQKVDFQIQFKHLIENCKALNFFAWKGWRPYIFEFNQSTP